MQQNAETGAIEIHFIDFEWAYRITDKFARKTTVEQKDASYFPKERTASSLDTPAPAFEQDIFSLGWWLNYCLEVYAKQHYAPSVKAYCELALSDNPHNRPSLLLFSEILKERISTVAKPLSTPSLSTTARLMQNGIGSTSPDSINYDSDFIHYDSNDESPSTSPQPAAKATSTQTLTRVRRSFNLVALASSETPPASLARTKRSLNLAAMVSPTRG